MRRAVVIAAVLVLAGCGGGGGGGKPQRPSAPSAPALGDFVGIYSDDVFFGDDAYKHTTLAQQHKVGIGLIRQPFAWNGFATNPGAYDDFVGAAAQAGVRVLPMVLGPAPGAPNATGGMAPPTDDSAFAAYAVSLVKRYGPAGSFWNAHPDVPKLPIQSWQIWNEPNIPAFWASGPDPAAYTTLLKTTAAAIRKADPRAEIVAAGLPTSHLGIPAAKFLTAMYAAGAKGSFDTVAVHAYAPTPAGVVAHARELADVVSQNGDDARVWITEFGWGTGGAPGPLTVSPEKQAADIDETMRTLLAERAKLRLRGVVIFQWHDPKPFPGRREIWPYHAGLLNVQGRPKPALGALQQALRAAS